MEIIRTVSKKHGSQIVALPKEVLKLLEYSKYVKFVITEGSKDIILRKA